MDVNVQNMLGRAVIQVVGLCGWLLSRKKYP